MERLTEECWRNLDPWECCGQDYYCKRDCHEEGGCTKGCIVPQIYVRLANYEDIGLAPEEVMELFQPKVEKNNPLTLEEMREMDGGRVWIERIGGRVPYDNGWAIVNRENCLCRTEDGCNAFFELYGIGWLAYRRKPEGGMWNERRN